MPRERRPRTWVRMDCEGLLRGSINYLLTLEGQAVWLKMIAFSEVCGGRPGFIEDNNRSGLPHEYIAQELHCPVALLEEVLDIMAKDKAIKINGTGAIELVNFKHYQFSEYDRQKPYREALKLAGIVDTDEVIEDGKRLRKFPPEYVLLVREVFDGIKERKGYKSRQPAGEALAINQMLQEGLQPKQILEAYDKIKVQQFYQDKNLTMMQVRKDIHEVLKNGAYQSKPGKIPAKYSHDKWGREPGDPDYGRIPASG